MRFMQLLRILRAHAGLVVVTLINAWVIAAILTAVATPKYVATSSVLVDFADTSSVTVKPPIQLYASYLATQIDLLASQTVALKAVDELRLAEDPHARAYFLGNQTSLDDRLRALKQKAQEQVTQWLGDESETPEKTADAADERYRLADQFLKRVTIRPSADSSVLQVSYAARSAQAAATAANALVKAYIDATLEFSVNPARTSSEWLDAQTQRLAADVQTARAKLADFQQRTGIVSTDAANDVDTSRLNDLNSQLVAAQSQNHPAIQALKSDLARAQAKLNDLPPQLGPNHPSYQRVQAEVETLRKQLQAESARLADDLRDEVAKQRGSILVMKRQHGQLASLQEEVASAQRALDDATEKANQARMDSQVTQTNVSVIGVAIPPKQPTTPNPLFNFALATAIGLVLGAGLGLWREVVCRFVRSADDLRDFLGLPVLGVLHGGPRSSSGRARLLSAPPSPALLAAER